MWLHLRHSLRKLGRLTPLPECAELFGRFFSQISVPGQDPDNVIEICDEWGTGGPTNLSDNELRAEVDGWSLNFHFDCTMRLKKSSKLEGDPSCYSQGIPSISARFCGLF